MCCSDALNEKKRNFYGTILCRSSADNVPNLPILFSSLPARLSFKTSAPKIPMVLCGWKGLTSSTLDGDGALASEPTADRRDAAPT